MGLVFEEIARNTGQELNVKATSERLGISYDTIKKYIDIIDHMHLLKKLVS
jgi:predicted AAA+ superfamily ATPase